MNASSNALTLTDTTARRSPRVVTPQTRALTQLAQTWTSLSGATQGGWETLAQQNANATVNGVPPRAGGYAAFIGHNAPLYAATLPVVTVAPARHDAPPLPGDLSLNAAFTGDLSLILNCVTAYPNRALIYGAKPMLAPRALYENTPFRLLAAVPTLSGAIDLSAFYLSRYRVLSTGYKIALHIVGVSAAGFRTAPLFLTAVAAGAGDAPTLTLA